MNYNVLTRESSVERKETDGDQLKNKEMYSLAEAWTVGRKM